MSQTQTGNQLLLSLSEKLNADSGSLTKAEEYFRAIRDKATGRYVDDFTKAILSLDLAAANSGLAFDKEKAQTLSGLKKQNYKAHVKLYEKLLNLSKPLGVPEVCVQLGCSEVKDLAQQILSKFEESNVTDGSNPMYAAAAVSVACRLKHIKVTKSKFVQISQLKAGQWKELEAKFQNCVETYFNAPNKKGVKTEEVFNEEAEVEEESQDVSLQETHVKGEGEGEDYETWKARILSEARAALQKEDENI